LWLLEYAHRRATGLPLCLAPKDIDEPALAQHLFEEACAVCGRWFANGTRAYERLARRREFAAADSLALDRTMPRPYDLLITSPAAAAAAEAFQQKWLPIEGVSGLDSLTRVLEWTREGGPGSRRWRIVVKFPAEENPPEELEQLKGLRLRVERFGSGAGEPCAFETRLGLDARHNIVSLPESWIVHDDPLAEVEVQLTDLGQADRPEAD
jgi:hypothetical protein